MPEVTRLVNTTAVTLSKELEKSEGTFCRRFGKILTDRGFMTQK